MCLLLSKIRARERVFAEEPLTDEAGFLLERVHIFFPRYDIYILLRKVFLEFVERGETIRTPAVFKGPLGRWKSHVAVSHFVEAFELHRLLAARSTRLWRREVACLVARS